MAALREAGSDGVAAVLPSDHLLDDAALDAIRGAEPLARDRLVTFGVTPTSPHTGYGYIRPGTPIPGGFEVDAFVEKPDAATADRYVRDGYLWNSGMFLLSTTVFFEELARLQPAIADAVATLPPDYAAMPSVSIDYGLLERSGRVAVAPLDAAWSDLGDFAAFAGAVPADSDGNAGEAHYLDSRDNFVRAEGKRVGLIGVEGLVVVDTDDALLVANKAETGRVRELVAALKAEGDPVVVHHREEHRPWGSYKVLEANGAYKIKRVTVRPGRRLSLQLHHHRSEHWIVVSGTAEVELEGGPTRLLAQGESTFVKTGQRHRLGNPGVIPLEVIEVQIGEYLEEDDIVRFEDVYGRS
jgi:mannose-1-phosphate guanylyltransferase/mannose-6-phosphate isomerase